MTRYVRILRSVLAATDRFSTEAIQDLSRRRVSGVMIHQARKWEIAVSYIGLMWQVGEGKRTTEV